MELKTKKRKVQTLLGFQLIILLVFSNDIFPQKINWMSFQEALEVQKEEPKKIFMDVYTDWCAPCKIMDALTFGHKDVAEFVNEHFYAVKFNAEGNDEFVYLEKPYSNPYFNPNRKKNKMHEFAQFLGIQGFPTVVFFNEKGEPIFPVTGLLNPTQLELYLKFINTDQHQSITTKEGMEEFIESFVPQFVSE
ncbi:MAG: thioredoxin fold domain-containing protein [Flavobacteriaceae bacterium]|nr:thioredoxin fold domain-containing protein [Flavobacteriaceae bacterium]